MTKFHSKRFLALFLAASVLMSQGGFTSLAEEGVESAPAVETMAEPETPARTGNRAARTGNRAAHAGDGTARAGT